MMRKRVVLNAGTHDNWLNTSVRLSGVVTRMWGGLRFCAARSFKLVSPERRPTRMKSQPSSASGALRFFCRS